MKDIVIKVIGDGSVKDSSFNLNIEELKQKAHKMSEFETGHLDNPNPHPELMKKLSGIKVINDNGNFGVYEVGNHYSFFSVNKLFDLKPQLLNLTYTMGLKIKNTLCNANQ